MFAPIWEDTLAEYGLQNWFVEQPMAKTTHSEGMVYTLKEGRSEWAGKYV